MPDLAPDGRLAAENAALRAENAALRAKNAALRVGHVELERVVAGLMERVAELERQLAMPRWRGPRSAGVSGAR